MQLARIALVVMVPAVALAVPSRALARDVAVATAAELRAAVEGALAGDVILVADGTYDVSGNVRASATGTAAEPIVVRGVTALGAHVRFDALEGFLVSGPYWTFEDLDIEGVCAAHSDCEHAFHVVGAADHTTIRGNSVHGFNAQIKANGSGDPRVWPDDVLIEDNELWNETARATSNPVTPIDVVGGRRWIIRGNFIHDHHKGGGDNVSYAAFLKGNGRDGVIERNLVICELLHTGGTRLGLSFGGGGSSPDSICEDGTCMPEHQGGIMRNNVVASCPTDVGIYVNECANCRVLHNTLYRSTGIDVRFTASSVEVIGNLLSGRVRARDGATLTASGNREMVSDAEFAAWFEAPAMADFDLVDGTELVDRGTALADVTDDFCGNARDDGMPDLGAVEYDGDGPCDTTMPGGPGTMPGVDGGVPGGDAGGAGGDGGGGALDAGGAGGSDGGGVGSDGGPPPGGGGEGCSCRASGRSAGGAAAFLGLALVLATTRRVRGVRRRLAAALRRRDRWS